MRFFASLLVALWMPVAVVAQNADDDVGYLTGLLQDALSGAGRDVRIRGFEGALSSEASIALLSISDTEGEWFRAENVVLEWTRSALLRGAVDVDSFTAERIVVSRAPISEDELPSAEAAPFEIPDLPVSIQIEEINAQSVILGAPLVGEDVEFAIRGSAALDGQAADIDFLLNRVDGQEAQIQLTASYDPDSRDLSVDFAAEEDANGLVARLLDVPGQPALALTVVGDGNVEDFEAQLALSTDGVPRVDGTIAILSPEAEESWDVRVDIDGDPSPIVTAEMQEFLGNDISLQARLIRDASGRIEVPQLSLGARSLSLEGSAAIGTTGWPEAFDVRGELLNPDGGPVVLPFGDAATTIEDITFEAIYANTLTVDAQLNGLDSSGATVEQVTLTGRGAIDPRNLSEDGQFELDVSWSADGVALTDPALAEAVGSSLSGAAEIDYASGQPIRATGIEVSGEDFGLTGTATWDTANTIPLGVDLRLIAQDVVRFSELAGRDLSGRAEVTIAGSVGPLSGMADLMIDGTTLDLQVGQDVADRVLAGVGSARIDIRRDESGTTLREARIVTSGANIEAAGKITSDETTLRFGGEIRRFDQLYPGEADGRADVSGTVALRGNALQQFELSADVSNQSQPVRLPFAGGITFDTAVVEVLARGGAQGSWTAQINSDDVQSSILSADLLALSGAGVLEQAETGGLVSIGGELSASGNDLRMADPRLARALGQEPSVVAEFDWTQDSARLTLDQFTLTTEGIDASGSALVRDTLSNPDAQFAVNVIARDFAPLSGVLGQPLQGRGTVDVTGRYTQDGPFDVTLDGQASGLGLGNPLINRLLAGVTTFDANVVGDANQLDRLSANISNPEITAQVNGPLTGLDISARLRDLGLIAPDFAGPLQIDGTVGQQGDRVTVDVDVDAPGNTVLSIDGSVRGGDSADLTIQGGAPLGLANAFIEPRRLNGRAQLDLALRGPLALSSLSGVITPSDAELSAPTLGIILDPITGQIRVQNGAAQIGLAAQGNNGGTLDVNGRLGLEGFDANLTATLNAFGLRDPALYDTSVDGTITLTGPIGRDLLIAGDLRLNETEIQVPSSGAFALGDIPNIDHLGATRPVMRTIERAGLNEESDAIGGPSGPATTRLDLTLNAPNQVFVRGRGIDAELGGSLQLTGPTNDIIPLGGFELVRGRLDVLNQRFVLDEGRIQLSGSFVPVIRFVASTEANGITVRVILEGPASSPDISFTSSPELPEDEVLAQLLFGRDLSSLSALQALELANAVATLAGGGAGGILTNLRDGFGLDDLDVSQTEDGTAAVRAGAYISDNVYTDVVVEGGGRTELNLNLDITSEITARGSVSNDGNSSIGVFFERDY